MEETNEILLQLRALIKSEDQFGCTKEIVLGCWCVNEWRCCSRKVQCVHTSAAALYSAAFDRFFKEKTTIFLPAVSGKGRDSKPARSSHGRSLRYFWPGAGACVASVALLILEHGTAGCLVPFECSAWHSLPTSVGRMMPMFIPSHAETQENADLEVSEREGTQ